jgi:CheY-like chemotaxis protein
MREIETERNSGLQADEGTEQRAATIVALTGMSSVEDRTRAFEAGVNS